MKSPQSRKQKSWTYLKQNERNNLHPGLVHPVRQKHIKTMKEIKVQVPEGITEFSVQVNGETATVVYETKAGETGKEEEWQPQDGEIIFAETSTGLQHFIFPYCHMESAIFHDIRGKFELVLDDCRYLYTSLRQATEDEKKMFHDALKEKGLRWNAEEKRVEKLPRWRAGKFSNYHFVFSDGTVKEDMETMNKYDIDRYNVGNYFKTEEAAERVAKQIREIFKNSKAE